MSMAKLVTCVVVTALAQALVAAAKDALSTYNVDLKSVTISGFSAGGFMAAQLGIAYSHLFKIGFGVFAGGPYDCARNQYFTICMNNNTPSIKQPLANMCAWSGTEIDCLCNLKHRRIYLQAATEDDTVGLRIAKLLESQLSHFTQPSNVTFVTSYGAAHTFPTDFDSEGNSDCNETASPYISNCGYDGAGAVFKWLYGEGLKDRNTGSLSGAIVPFAQTGMFGAPGMASTGFLYVPETCRAGDTSVCKLHVALHGCTMNYELIGDKFVVNTGYNLWADTNDMIILYPQTTVDNATHHTWSGNLTNANACWDWIGQFGDADRKGGVQMEAIVNMIKRIAGDGHNNCSARSYHGSLKFS